MACSGDTRSQRAPSGHMQAGGLVIALVLIARSPSRLASISASLSRPKATNRVAGEPSTKNDQIESRRLSCECKVSPRSSVASSVLASAKVRLSKDECLASPSTKIEISPPSRSELRSTRKIEPQAPRAANAGLSRLNRLGREIVQEPEISNDSRRILERRKAVNNLFQLVLRSSEGWRVGNVVSSLGNSACDRTDAALRKS